MKYTIGLADDCLIRQNPIVHTTFFSKPGAMVHDKNGEIYTVRYDAVNAMLLNEFLREHRKVEQLTKDFESKLAEQQKQIEALTAGLQKVSDQLELNKSAPRTVVNNP
jgi:hypothetical protein